MVSFSQCILFILDKHSVSCHITCSVTVAEQRFGWLCMRTSSEEFFLRDTFAKRKTASVEVMTVKEMVENQVSSSPEN